LLRGFRPARKHFAFAVIAFRSEPRGWRAALRYARLRAYGGRFRTA